MPYDRARPDARRVSGLLAMLLLCPALAMAQPPDVSVLSLQLLQPDGGPRMVPALLTRPAGAAPWPAVVMIPDAWGLDGRTASLAMLLAEQGWAVLELDLRPLSLDGHLAAAATSLDAVPDAWDGALDLAQLLPVLAERPEIDPEHIAVVGLGLGGRMALLAAAEDAMAPLGPYGPRYAAHAALYPGCTDLVAEGYAEPAAWSAAPAALFHGGQDTRDAPGACDRLLASLRASGHDPSLWQVYPDATYGWDFGMAGQGQFIRLPQPGGPLIAVVSDDAVAEDAAQRLTAFLRGALGSPAPSPGRQPPAGPVAGALNARLLPAPEGH